MRQFLLLLFVTSILLICWFGMVALHELGHVLGAWVTGGTVLRVVIHPLAIAHTEVFPNPSPGVVAWMGPLVGVVAPLVAACSFRRRGNLGRLFAFFAGFCLIANGTYISLGSFQGVGDSGQIMRAGTPQIFLLAFGVVSVPCGLWIWHQLGSLPDLTRETVETKPFIGLATFGILLLLVIMQIALSS